MPAGQPDQFLFGHVREKASPQASRWRRPIKVVSGFGVGCSGAAGVGVGSTFAGTEEVDQKVGPGIGVGLGEGGVGSITITF